MFLLGQLVAGAGGNNKSAAHKLLPLPMLLAMPLPLPLGLAILASMAGSPGTGYVSGLLPVRQFLVFFFLTSRSEPTAANIVIFLTNDDFLSEASQLFQSACNVFRYVYLIRLI